MWTAEVNHPGQQLASPRCESEHGCTRIITQRQQAENIIPQTGEQISICCFEQLSFGIICYSALL